MTWHQLSLINGWTSDAGQGTGTPSWAVRNGIVYLRGSLHETSGGDPVFAELPRAARPARLLEPPIYTFGGTNGLLEIFPSGQIDVKANPFSQAQQYTSLAGLSYPAAASPRHALRLINGWKRSTGFWDGAPSYLISNGVVYLTGAMHQRLGGNEAFGTLPKAARPSHRVYVTVGTWKGSPGVLRIYPSGVMFAYGRAARSETWLGGVSFPLASVTARKLALVNGWISGQAHYKTGDPAYSVHHGVVYLSGSLVQPSAGNEQFATLPAGSRPAHSLYIAVYTYGGTVGTLFIQPNGSLQAYSPDTADAQMYTSLAGISFPLSS